jgi:hypothetical protein
MKAVRHGIALPASYPRVGTRHLAFVEAYKSAHVQCSICLSIRGGAQQKVIERLTEQGAKR